MRWVWQADCCHAKPGIGAPGCCEGTRQSGNPTAVVAERPAYKLLGVSVVLVAPAVVTSVDAVPIIAEERIDARAAPPGGTLFAQHTSLVL